MVPLETLEPLHEDRGALHVLAAGLTHVVLVVRQDSAHKSVFDSRIAVFGGSFLGVVDGLEHDKSEVEALEDGTSDANLTGSHVLLEVVADVHVRGCSGQVSQEDDFVGVLG